MLVLSRKYGESLIIDGEIEIKIIEIMGDKVRIGIEAPKNHKVLRKELVQTVETNQQASKSMVTKDLINFISELNRAQNEEQN